MQTADAGRAADTWVMFGKDSGSGGSLYESVGERCLRETDLGTVSNGSEVETGFECGVPRRAEI